VKTQRTLLVASVLTLVLIGLIPIIGCNALHPDELCGWWKEEGYERQILFDKGGDFRLEEFDQQPQGIIVGTGTWEVKGKEVSIKLNSGHMNWVGQTATTPSTLTFEYSVSSTSLTLTEAEGVESATYNWLRK